MLFRSVTGFSHRSGIDVKLDLPATLQRFPIELETAIFRVVQEGSHQRSPSLWKSYGHCQSWCRGQPGSLESHRSRTQYSSPGPRHSPARPFHRALVFLECVNACGSSAATWRLPLCHPRNSSLRRSSMSTCLLGVTRSCTLDSFIHILLVAALVALLIRAIQGRSATA